MAHEFGLEIFFQYREINHLEIKFWVKNTLLASYSRALIAYKMCWKVPSVTISTKTFEWKGIFGCGLNVLGSTHTVLEFEHKICILFDGNQNSYFHLNMSHRVSRKTESNYVPMNSRKNGSLTILSRIWLGNIFPISRDQ